LSLADLGVEPGIAAGLARAGLRSAGEADARPRAELAARFGPGLLAVLDGAFGRADAPISPRRPVPDAIAEQRFPEPVATQAAVRGAVRALAGTLGGLLERRQEGARLLELAVFRADGAVRRVAVETGRPTRDPRIVDRLFGERLDALSDPLDPGFGFDLVRLSAHRIEPLRPRAVTLDARTLDDEEIAELVDRLAARYGGRRVLRFQAQDTHLPEAAARAVPAQAARPRASSPDDAEHPPSSDLEPPSRPISLFDPPEPIEVLAEIPEGPPARFRWRRVLRPVVRAEGPERIAMEWWRSSGPGLTRDYYRVEDGQGRRYWIFRAGLYGRETSDPRWFLHGLFA
jgi:protein ImuB